MDKKCFLGLEKIAGMNETKIRWNIKKYTESKKWMNTD